MELYICNKCFAPIYRGSHPYYITQCAHIYCKNCIQQVETRCLQCEHVSPAYLPLNEPLQSKTLSYFASPDTQIWELLLKTQKLEENQMMIMMRRFHEIEEKYKKLKVPASIDRHNLKVVKGNYKKLKEEKEKVEKMKQQLKNMNKMRNNSGLSSQTMKTVTDSYPTVSMRSSDTPRSAPMEFLNFPNMMTPISERSSGNSRYQTDADGFRIPNNPSSGNNIFTPDTSYSSCHFKK